MEKEAPSSLEALLRQGGNQSVDDVNSSFGDDNFGGFEGEIMDYDNDNEWKMESDDELQDDKIDDKLTQSIRQSSDYANRIKKEIDNRTSFIAIVMEDTAMQECSSFCACNKSIRSIPTISLSADILSYNLLLMMKDIPIYNFKSVRRIVLFLRICLISSVKGIIHHLRSNLTLHYIWMSFFSFTRCISKDNLRSRFLLMQFILLSKVNPRLP